MRMNFKSQQEELDYITRTIAESNTSTDAIQLKFDANSYTKNDVLEFTVANGNRMSARMRLDRLNRRIRMAQANQDFCI